MRVSRGATLEGQDQADSDLVIQRFLGQKMGYALKMNPCTLMYVNAHITDLHIVSQCEDM